MATATAAPENTILRSSEESVALALQLRRLARVGTYVAILVSPAAFFFFRREDHLSFTWSLVCTVLVILGFRGFLALVIRRLIPCPSLFGTDDARLQEEDIVNRRRAWTWRFAFRLGIFLAFIITVVWLKQVLFNPTHVAWPTAGWHILRAIGHLLGSRTLWIQLLFG